LVGEREDRDPAEIDLLLARQCQQQIDRSLIPVEVEYQLLRSRRPLTPALSPPPGRGRDPRSGWRGIR
jgi:hypothetical protein